MSDPSARVVRHPAEIAPCVFCGYYGAGFFQIETHTEGCPWRNVGGLEERIEAFPSVLANLASQLRERDERIGELESERRRDALDGQAVLDDYMTRAETAERKLKEAYEAINRLRAVYKLCVDDILDDPTLKPGERESYAESLAVIDALPSVIKAREKK